MTGQDLYSYFESCGSVCTDTRHLIPGSIFFALKGDNFNGNAFAAKAIESGCAYAVIDEPEHNTGKKTLLVPNVLLALQDLARYHRTQLTIPVIGITGSNGKTSTKELVSAVLSAHFDTYATKGNLNNHIGVPLSLLEVTAAHKLAVIEMGANHAFEIGELCSMSQPDFGLITNIGKAHLEGFGSLEVIQQTKKELYDAVRKVNGTVFVNSDDALLMRLSEGIERVTYGLHGSVKGTPQITVSEACLSVDWNGQLIRTKLIGDYNFPNIMAALCIGQHFGVPAEKAIAAIEGYTPTNNRSQLVKTAHNTLVMDAYNANPVSMQAAVTNFMRIAQTPPLFILGDMRELGPQSEAEHQAIVALLQGNGVKDVILVGTEFAKVTLPANYLSFATATDAQNHLRSNPVRNRWVLVKGSRGIALERIREVL